MESLGHVLVALIGLFCGGQDHLDLFHGELLPVSLLILGACRLFLLAPPLQLLLWQAFSIVNWLRTLKTFA